MSVKNACGYGKKSLEEKGLMWPNCGNEENKKSKTKRSVQSGRDHGVNISGRRTHYGQGYSAGCYAG